MYPLTNMYVDDALVGILNEQAIEARAERLAH